MKRVKNPDKTINTVFFSLSHRFIYKPQNPNKTKSILRILKNRL